MSERQRIPRRLLIAASALVVLVLSAEVFAGGCRTGRGYVRSSHFTNGYSHGPYNYYPSRHLRRARTISYRYCRPTYLRFRDRFCNTSPYNYYPRRSLYYSNYSSFTPARRTYITCNRCRSSSCDGACHERGLAVRSADPPVNVMLITSADRKAAKDPAVLAAAWKLIEDGYPDEALLEFTRLASASAKAAEPKLGYSLAAAMIDDDYNAQWAMRRALRVDPDGVKSFTASPALAARLSKVATRYETKASESKRPADARFLAASIHFLLHEYDDAQVNLDPLLAAGDTQRSTTTLRDLVQAKLGSSAETLVQAPAPEAPAPQKVDESSVQLVSSQSDS